MIYGAIALTRGYAALHAAASCGNDDLVRALVEAGARIDMLTDFGETPLDIAIFKHRHSTQALLRSLGAHTAAELQGGS